MATPLAARNGLRYAATNTWVCTAIRRVAAAANASATSGSWAWCPPPASQRSSGAGWSVTKTASSPAASTAAAISAIASPVTNSSGTRDVIDRESHGVAHRPGTLLSRSPSREIPMSDALTIDDINLSELGDVGGTGRRA